MAFQEDNHGFDTDRTYAKSLDRVNTFAIAVILAALTIVILLLSLTQSYSQEAGSSAIMYPQISSGHIQGRPVQCPRRFCGCDLSIEIFGRADPSLFPAVAWYRFPRAHPAPGMVAVRKHHVMRLIAPAGGSNWTVRDPNSGGGLTRVHTRSIVGFTIVDPRRGGA